MTSAHAFRPAQTIHRPALAQALGRPLAKLMNLARQSIGRHRHPGAFICEVRLPPGAQQRIAAVLELASDARLRSSRGKSFGYIGTYTCSVRGSRAT
jgi:hypothetical protein